MNNKPTIPCINCITLPICKAQVLQSHHIGKLLTKCSLVREYVAVIDSKEYQHLLQIPISGFREEALQRAEEAQASRIIQYLKEK
jgi:hypothetical protein